MQFNLVDIFCVITNFQLLFISIFLFSRDKGKAISNRLLGAFFLAVTLNLADKFLILKNSYLYSPDFALWGTSLPLLFGPLLYLYTRSVLFRNFELTRKKWLHFLPFIIVFSWTESGYLLQNRELKQSILDYVVSRKVPFYINWALFIIFVQFIIYIFFTFRIVNRYKIGAAGKFSDLERVNMSWLYNTILFFTGCMFVSVCDVFVGMTSLVKYYYPVLSLIIIGLFVFTNRVLFKTLRMPELFMWLEENPAAITINGNTVAKYAGSGLPENEKKKIHDTLLMYMKTCKPYLEPELTIEQLSSKLSVRPKALSQVINESLQQNFFDFINRYRIEEAKHLLKAPPDKKMTVSEILYEVGFNSKSSFYTLFKKYTGLTPKDFQKSDS